MTVSLLPNLGLRRTGRIPYLRLSIRNPSLHQDLIFDTPFGTRSSTPDSNERSSRHWKTTAQRRDQSEWQMIRLIRNSEARFPTPKTTGPSGCGRVDRAPEGQRNPFRASPFPLFPPPSFLYPQFQSLSHQVVFALTIRRRVAPLLAQRHPIPYSSQGARSATKFGVEKNPCGLHFSPPFSQFVIPQFPSLHARYE